MSLLSQEGIRLVFCCCNDLCRQKFRSQEALREGFEKDDVDYAGATNDPDRRSKEHYQKGYRGTMMYAETENMKEDEDYLLDNYECPKNNLRKSGIGMEPGYVYGIKPDSGYGGERGCEVEPGYGRKGWKEGPGPASEYEPGYGRRNGWKVDGYRLEMSMEDLAGQVTNMKLSAYHLEGNSLR